MLNNVSYPVHTQAWNDFGVSTVVATSKSIVRVRWHARKSKP